ARKAAHPLLIAEEVAIDGVHHPDHESRLLDHGRLDGERFDLSIENLWRVAAGAILRGCGGEHPHRVDKLVYRDPLEHADVLEERLGHPWCVGWRRRRGCTLARGHGDARQADERRREKCEAGHAMASLRYRRRSRARSPSWCRRATSTSSRTHRSS